MPELSVILPAYNEQKRICESIQKIYQFLTQQGYEFEIIVVDDGSKDATGEAVSKLSETIHNLKLVSYEKNMGKGYAIKTGFQNVCKQYVMFTDVDLPVPLWKICEFIKFFDMNYDMIIGSRTIKGAGIIKRQNLLREILGRGYRALTQLILPTRITDFTCGFKFFSRPVAKWLSEKMRIYRWGFDAEIIFLTQNKFKIKELPVFYTHPRETKVRLLRDVINSFIELIKLKIRL